MPITNKVPFFSETRSTPYSITQDNISKELLSDGTSPKASITGHTGHVSAWKHWGQCMSTGVCAEDTCYFETSLGIGSARSNVWTAECCSLNVTTHTPDRCTRVENAIIQCIFVHWYSGHHWTYSYFKATCYPKKSAQSATTKTNSSTARVNSHAEENINDILIHILKEINLYACIAIKRYSLYCI